MNRPDKIRLNKRLVELNLASSRRLADELIIDGQVSINGQIVNQLATLVAASDSIKVAGKLGQSRANITIAFNKPTGYVCTHKPQGTQNTIYSLLPKKFISLKCVGRLDKDSQGLLILSSDGDLVQTLSHPTSQKEKEYIVSTTKPLKTNDINQLRRGIKLSDGISYFESVSQINSRTVRVVLTSGRNRQIRRSFEALEHNVAKLERVRVGKYKLLTLPTGKFKFIEPGELL